MSRLSLLAIVVCASACDIVGDLPENVGADVDAFQSGCSGRNPRYNVFVRVDATLDKRDELEMFWNFGSQQGANVVFQPTTLDCGWWSGGVTYQNDTDGIGNGSGQEPVSAHCTRGSGPPRQIIMLAGTATLRDNSSGDVLIGSFEARSASIGASDSAPLNCR